MRADSASFGRIDMPLPLEFVFFGLTLAVKKSAQACSLRAGELIDKGAIITGE